MQLVSNGNVERLVGARTTYKIQPISILKFCTTKTLFNFFLVVSLTSALSFVSSGYLNMTKYFEP